MTYVITENCIKCKHTDCVEVCPVDAFYEGENMLVIHPDECLDCGTCEPECPVDAIRSDTAPGIEPWLELNRKYALVWPNITAKKQPLANAGRYDGEADKLGKYFSATAGTGSPDAAAPLNNAAMTCCGGTKPPIKVGPASWFGNLLRTIIGKIGGRKE